ncbi:MAG: mechanosensitive ion channel family protein, partial [Woeseiaceae bacterium]
MNEIIDRAQTWAEFLGPNVYLQAAALALAFILIGKIAEVILSKAFAKIVARSKTDFDDDLVALLHKPIFVTFVLVGLALATRRLEMPTAPEYITLGILKTIAIFIWYGFFSGLVKLLLSAARRGRLRKMLHASMLPLTGTILRVLLIALAIYFVFLAWNINVTAWVASAGIVGLALSFAARDTLSNLFAGFSIVADAPYKTGDFIILESGERGMVTQIGLRSTRILTRDDVEITVPNGIIGNAKIIN